MSDLMIHPVSSAEIAIAVPNSEYLRLLGLPRHRELDGELLARARWARQWYAEYGGPFRATRRAELKEVSGDSVPLHGGHCFTSDLLAARLRKGEAHAVVAIAATAGHEVSEFVSKCWAEGRPDEAFFLDRFAVGVTEWLIYSAAAALCRSWVGANETLLPHLSPGCGKWDFSDQHNLMSFLAGTRVTEEEIHLGPLTLMSSGALHPQHSVLALQGVSRRTFITTPEYLCRTCDCHPCAYRRAPYTTDAIDSLELR